MNMKKIKIILSILLIGIVSFFNANMKVNAYSSQETFSSRILTGQYIKKLHSDGSGKYKSIGMLTRNSDGHFVYCVQPWMDLDEGGTYNANSSGQAEKLGVSGDTWRRISLIAYYGYGYPGHSDERWYGITQLMIWKTVDPSGNFFFTYTANGATDYRYDWMRDEIENLINNHYVEPRFNNTNLTLNLGESITLTDSNGVLNNFTLSKNNNNISANKSGNNLTITANSVGSSKITLTKNLSNEGTDNTTVLYDYLDKQKTISRGYVDPVDTDININVIGGKIRIKKVDSETKQITAQGNASMIGAVYEIYDSNNNKVDTITIGSDSTAITKALSRGTYKIVEKSSGNHGYKVNPATYNVTISESKTYDVQVEDEVVKAKIKIYKYDSKTKQCNAQGEATLVGAKYDVINSKGNRVDTLTIGNDCTATSKLLPYDRYTIKEINNPVGYNIDTNTYTVNIVNETQVDLTVYDNVIQGKVKIYKKDADNNNTTARGQGSLIGAKYGLYDMNDNLIDTLVIGDNYQAISKSIPYGHYKIKEVEASEGYKLDTKVYEVNINEESEVEEITSKEKVIENHISLLKQYDYIDGQTAFLNAEADVKFDIYYPNGDLYTTITTNKHGYANILMPYGVWKFHQVNTHTGYEKIYDFYVTVNRESEEEQYYNILNNKIAAYLKVIKKDLETGKTISIANTKFRIFNRDTNQYVSQYVSGKVYDTFTTDNDGTFTTYLKLEAGNYKLVEVSSPKNYLLNSDGLEFTIGEDTHYAYTTYGAIVTIEFYDKQIKGVIEINKTGEVFTIEEDTFNYNGRKNLEGIVYHIIAAEDIKSDDGNYIYYQKDKLVDTLTTNNIGYAKSKQLPLGKYIVYEFSTIGDYILDSKQYEVELTEKDNRTEIVYSKLKLTNTLKKGDLEFTKTDLVNGDVIPNTVIEIYTENDELIYHGKTDKDGKVIIKNLPLNTKFYIIEKDCEGYVITDDKVYFEIKEDGEVVKAEMKNKPITGDLEFTKLDYSNDEPIENTIIEIYNDKDELEFTGKTDKDGKVTIKNIRYGKHYILEKEAPEKYTINKEKMYFEIKEDGEIVKATMKDKVKQGTLVFTKTDISESETLPNTVIEIYTENDELIYHGKTDKDGKIVLPELEYGKYYILEKEAPEGYELNEEKMYFEIKEDGEIVKATMKDKEIPHIDVPDTDIKDSNHNFAYGIEIIILGIVTIVYAIIKKKKKK